MATKKSGGTAKNLRDSNPKYLGVKLFAGEYAIPGSIIVRQRGTHYTSGTGTRMGKDHTIFSDTSGVVAFRDKRKTGYDGRRSMIKEVSVNG